MTTYYVDVTTGNDGDDGLSEVNAWQTLHHAADQVAAGDLVHVKGSADYVVEDGANDCVMLVDTAGTAVAPIVIRGYTTNPGDGGTVTINAGTNALASAVITSIGAEVNWKFENIRFTGGGGDGFDANGVTDSSITFENCRFDNNTGWGFQGNDKHIFFKCQADNNTAGGIDADSYCHIIACKIFSNSGIGVVTAGSGSVCGNLLYENGGNIYIFVTTAGTLVTGNTIDGDNQAGSIGIKQDIAAANGQGFAIINNIIFDCDTGVRDDGNTLLHIWDYNLFYSCNTDYDQVTAGANDVTGTSDPFTDSGANDYTLKSGSEALNKGLDQDAFMDMGAFQQECAGGNGSGRRSRIRQHGV